MKLSLTRLLYTLAGGPVASSSSHKLPLTRATPAAPVPALAPTTAATTGKPSRFLSPPPTTHAYESAPPAADSRASRFTFSPPSREYERAGPAGPPRSWGWMRPDVDEATQVGASLEQGAAALPQRQMQQDENMRYAAQQQQQQQRSAERGFDQPLYGGRSFAPAPAPPAPVPGRRDKGKGKGPAVRARRALPPVAGPSMSTPRRGGAPRPRVSPAHGQQQQQQSAQGHHARRAPLEEVRPREGAQNDGGGGGEGEGEGEGEWEDEDERLFSWAEDFGRVRLSSLSLLWPLVAASGSGALTSSRDHAGARREAAGAAPAAPRAARGGHPAAQRDAQALPLHCPKRDVRLPPPICPPSFSRTTADAQTTLTRTAASTSWTASVRACATSRRRRRARWRRSRRRRGTAGASGRRRRGRLRRWGRRTERAAGGGGGGGGCLLGLCRRA